MNILARFDCEGPRIFPVFFICILFLLIPAFPVQPEEPEEIFFGIHGETNMYSRKDAAIGGGLFLGMGRSGAALGIQALFFRDPDNLRSLEISAFVRLYLPYFSGNSGLFAQCNLGPCLFWEEDNDKRGTICMGLGLGWRFLLGENFFLEPSVRAGYPFIAGAGIAAGLRI